MARDPHLTRTLRRMHRARRFPHNTCPASRHAQLIAEALAGGRDRLARQLDNDDDAL